MIRTAVGSLSAVLLLGVSPGHGQNADCIGGPAVEPECGFEIRGGGPGASDLGIYNVRVQLERFSPTTGSASLTVGIDASRCGEPTRRYIEEPVRFADAETTLKFNFPLLLHASEADGNFCVRVVVFGCGNDCTGQFGLTVGESAVMRQVTDPALR